MICSNWRLFWPSSCIVLVIASVLIETAETRSTSVVVPPLIVDGPNFHESFREGYGTKELPCHASGTQPISYEWRRNGALLNTSERIKLSDSDGRLHINNPEDHMEGYYQCFASNRAGVAMSNVTFLQAAVLEPIGTPRERTSTRSLRVVQYDHLVLPCRHILRSIPSADLDWHYSTDGGHVFWPVRHDDRVRLAGDGSLVFSSVRPTDSGIYKCICYNWILLKTFGGSKVNLTIETNETASAENKLAERPVLLYASPDSTVLQGGNVTLSCIFGSWPNYEVIWIGPAGRKTVGHVLEIANVSAADSGMYSCQGHKLAGINRDLYSQTFSISVHVDAVPEFNSTLSNQEIHPGDGVAFVCEAYGRPLPDVTWYENGKSLEKSASAVNRVTQDFVRTSTLRLRNIHRSFTVTCNISNVHGYRLQSAYAMLVASTGNSEVISSTSSQDLSPDRPASERPLSTREKQEPFAPTSVSISVDVRRSSVINNNQDAALSGKTSSQLPETDTDGQRFPSTVVIAALVAVAVVVVSAAVVIIACARRRRRRRHQSYSINGGDLPLRQLPPDLHQNDQSYDSDDSGFDDLKGERSEQQRALRMHPVAS